MNSRERVQAVLDGKKPDRLPFNFWMDRPLMKELDSKFGEEFRINHYGADVYESFFGFDWDSGFKVVLTNDGRTSLTAPMIKDMRDIKELVKFDKVIYEGMYNNLVADRKRFPETSIFAMTLTPLESFFSLRSMENALMDFYEYPEEAEYFIYQKADFLTKMIKGLSKYRKDIDVLYLAGDICSSQGSIISPEMLRKYCFEPIKDAIEEAHKLDLKVFFHSDGNLSNVLPLYVEYGLDGCNPLQPHLNDSKAFKENYGKKLILYGGIDNCFAIPDSDVNGVRQHILSQYEILGRDGGLIFSSHDIPFYVNIENVNIMVETIKSIKL